jgi:K(+)-stimulated pyrophosphate-energized sodium pump
MFVKTSPGAKIMNALYRGLAVAGVLALVAFYPMTTWLIDDRLLDSVLNISGGSQMRLYAAAVIGWC